MRTISLTLILIFAGPSWAAPSCAVPLTVTEREWDFRAIVPRNQLVWRAWPKFDPNEERDMRIANPALLSLAVSPNGQRALASFRSGEVVLFGPGEPKLLYAVAPTSDPLSEYNIAPVQKLNWFDDHEFAAARDVRAEDSIVETPRLTRGRVDDDGDYEEIDAHGLSAGVDWTAMRGGLLVKPQRTREAALLPRDLSATGRLRASFDRPERPVMAVTPSGKKVALVDWFLTRRIAQLYFWDPTSRTPPELHVDFRDSLDPLKNVADLTSVRAIGESQVALTLKNHIVDPQQNRDGIYVYGKKLVRQKVFEPHQTLLAVSDRGRFVLTLDHGHAQGPRLELWRAKGKSFVNPEPIAVHLPEIERAWMSESPLRIWIFNTHGTVRVLDLETSK